MVNNNQFYSSILEKNNIYLSEEQFRDKVRTALKKMQMFLSDYEITISLKEVKQKNRIEIKGVADNGKERLLQQEIIEKYGIDILEESEGYLVYNDWLNILSKKYKTLVEIFEKCLKWNSETNKWELREE